MYKKNEKEICMMSIYVDDNFLVGHEEALDEEIDQIKSTFNIKIQTEGNDYLGCEFLVSEDSKKCWLGQLTENDAQHTFKAPCSCFENAPNTDLLFFEQSM